MESIWIKTAKRPTFSSLQNDIKTDVLIIGGGIAGLLCGYELKNAGIDCVIAEADEICSGTTQNTTAKITFHHGAIYNKMINKYGVEKTCLYANANEKALNMYQNLCREINCDFEDKNSYVYSLYDRQKIENEVLALQKIGYKASFTEHLDLPIETAGAVCVENQGQFNPLKFTFNIAKSLKIYENTRVLEIIDNVALTNHGKISANYIIVATHFPFINTSGGYFIKMYQHRSYVLALKNAQKLNGIYVDESKEGLSFRNYNDILLLGGGGHQTGKSGGNWNELKEFAKDYYPDSQEVCRWAAQDCITLDDIPYIGKYSSKNSNILVATGFNKWGMTGSMISAMLLKDYILGKTNEYSEVFLPNRSILSVQFVKNLTNSLLGMVRPTTPRCPHLGCALIYNKAEHSWDCPCHGSRFDSKGNLLNNPATKDKVL